MSRHQFRFYWIIALLLIPCLGAVGQNPQKQEDNRPNDGKPVIAVFDLSGPIAESPIEDPLPLFSAPGSSLKDLVARFRKAAADPAVKAVVLLADDTSAGPAQIEELRQAIKHIRLAGKEVHVHTATLDMGTYVLLSGASRISMVPTGMVMIPGLHAELPYVRGLLDKIDVKPDFYTRGQYKSAAEVFTREGPSPEADQMQNWLLDGLYNTYVTLIAEGRGVDAAKARGWIDAALYTTEQAKAAGIIDAIEQRQDFQAMLQGKFGADVTFERKYGKAKPPQLDFSSPFALFKIWGDLLRGAQKPKPAKDAVAIVYVDGPILVGRQQGILPLLFGKVAMSTAIRKALHDAAKDESIKAVVLRIDSPGGSATASEIILDATRRVKDKKPFAVSMGNIAGSGGYYVACGADTIFADRNTITASIGVVSGKLVTTGLWNNIGINIKTYKRGKNAGMFAGNEPFSDDERARLQELMNEVYDTFRGHVVASRGDRLKKPIDQIAGGRVFTGQQALEVGLVDKIGTLQDAIHHVAQQAKLKEYDVRVIPEPKSLLERILEDATGAKDDSDSLVFTPDAAGPRAAAAAGDSLVERAAPYLQHLDPQRVSVIQRLLAQLQLLQQEGVVLMMPEFVIAN